MANSVDPKVTMIIISYNEKDFLPRAINSCFMQTYVNKEIIIGDDGSNDGSIELIQSYLNQRIRYFVMERNEERETIIPSLRVSNIIKRAIELTDGDYYVILSGDDYYIDDQMLSKAVDFLKENLSYCSYVYGFQKTSDYEILETIRPRKLSPFAYYSGDYIHISCFVFRKIASNDLLDRFCDDTGFEYVLANRGKWKYDGTIAFSYYQREASIMHKADQTELSVIEMMVFQDILNWKYSTSFRSRIAAYSRYYTPYKYLLHHEYREKKYQKYLLNSTEYSNDLLNNLKSRKILLIKMAICHYGAKIARKLRL